MPVPTTETSRPPQRIYARAALRIRSPCKATATAPQSANLFSRELQVPIQPRSKFALWAGLSLWLTFPLPIQAQATVDTASASGLVVDALTGEPVLAAVVRLSLSPIWTVTDDKGMFELSGLRPGWQVIRFEATGYQELNLPVEAGDGAKIRAELFPAPLPLEGFEVEVQTFRTRLNRRRNARYRSHAFVLDAELLAASEANDLWELVEKRHGLWFDGFGTFGCPMAWIYGRRTMVHIVVNERPLRLEALKDFRPGDFALVEVWDLWNRGRHSKTPEIWAYTQEYLERMESQGRQPRHFETMAYLCPAPSSGL